jgi:hypothetical protein
MATTLLSPLILSSAPSVVNGRMLWSLERSSQQRANPALLPWTQKTRLLPLLDEEAKLSEGL